MMTLTKQEKKNTINIVTTTTIIIINTKTLNNTPLEDLQLLPIILPLPLHILILPINLLILLEAVRTALDRSPVSFISSSELTAKNFEENIEEHLFPSGLLLFSFCGFLLVFLVGIFLFRIFKSSEREMLSSSHSRELQIVLVPKNRLIKNSPIFPVKEENLEEEQKELLNEQQQPVISGRKLFPKRIYEIQAEEGYYSCPPSMRASFEAD
ncbi:unnamed protein product [Meloidogyne enterolobii]|uniref:Uncharacterized protein n=1 Tax=Meloidogyne enterolobii TaxID=390850 RepID=A0ACB1AXM7_MELEN